MKTLCRIFTQYFDENGKPKGGLEFTTYVDADEMMYAPEELLVKTFQDLLDAKWEREGYGDRVEYRSHELVFHEPMSLDGDEFSKLLEKAYNEVN